MPISCKFDLACGARHIAACVAAMRFRQSIIVALMLLTLAGTGYGERVRLLDGTIIEADDAWEDGQGVWYRQRGVTRLIERSRVRAIERSADAKEIDPTKPKLEQTSSAVAKADRFTKAGALTTTTREDATAPVHQSIWIYLIGGARVEADEVTETQTGAWSRRGNLSIFFERARIERIEREPLPQLAHENPASQTWRARGWSTGNARLDELIKSNGARDGVDPYLIFCVMEQESHFNARAVSPVGARGLMQLMPGTGARFGVRRFYDAAENVRGGTRYLKQLLEQFGGRVDLVLAGYNAGEGAVMKYGGHVPPYRETRNYVQRISKRYGQSAPQPQTQHGASTATPTISQPVAVSSTTARLQ